MIQIYLESCKNTKTTPIVGYARVFMLLYGMVHAFPFVAWNIKSASTSQTTVNGSTNDVILLGSSVSNLSVSVQGASVYATLVLLLPFIK